MCYKKNYKKKHKKKIKANLKKFLLFELFSATWKYKVGVVSNRKLACYGEICTKALHTLPITFWKYDYLK